MNAENTDKVLPDYAVADRQRLIEGARTQLRKEMRRSPKLYLQVTVRRFLRQGLINGRSVS